ncbi:MAG: FAD-dependent monooxygenase, partial [Solirubrobacteraceae bacterium]|nr:FAD-dependent monooxygenase [Solirubrobacteraceae bacterium]
SSGARDAGNLAWKLADVIDGAPAGLLDSYESERRPHVAAMQRLATSMGRAVQATRPRQITIRDTVLGAFDGSPLQRWAVANVKPLPTCAVGAFATRPARLPYRRTTGTLFPQSDRLDDRLGGGWAAVSIDDVATSLLSEAGLPVVDPGADRSWLEARGLTWAILRPDRFVFGCGAAPQVEAAVAAWRALSAPPLPARPLCTPVPA